ncbi:MAG: HPr(Ser) kinase/phosphatase [Acidobacteriota bacterium]|nr:HPr(Ser) kinase/phosphatase [Acidobacteriota bacterium]
MGDASGDAGKTVPDVSSVAPVSISVRDLVEESAPELRLEVLRGREYLDNKIGSAQVQKLGMALVGTSGDIHPDRVQVIGRTESKFLQSMEDEDRRRAIQRIKKYEICCIVVVEGAVVPEEMLQLSYERRIPFLQGGEPGDASVAKLTRWLEKRLAPRVTLHGGLLDVFGLGVLILGPSGIGKSECALELVLKGHRLIADDYVEITRHGIDQLSGEGGKVLRHHMELRGLGIIDIKELYGISATGSVQDIDFIVRLERWRADGVYDRIGIEKSSLEILGVPLPVIDIPVAPGRNVSTLVEVAARIHLLHQRGYKTSEVSFDG